MPLPWLPDYHLDSHGLLLDHRSPVLGRFEPYLKSADLPLLADRLGSGLGEVAHQESDVLLLGDFYLAITHLLFELDDEVARVPELGL